MTTDCDVAIVGLGPTGLLLSHLLGMSGHRVVVLEREPRLYGNARSVYTDDECMRLLQSAKVVEDVRRRMLPDAPCHIMRPDGRVIAQYAPLERPFGWPVVNFFYQPYLETSLADLLSRYPGVEVRRGREAVDLSQDDDGVVVTHRATTDGASDPERLRARFLVGADGGRSFVRSKLQIKMEGRSFPEPWLVVDLAQKDRERGLRHLPYFIYMVDPGLPTVSCVQPEGFHRFEFRLKPHQKKEELERSETVRKLLSRWVDPDAFVIKRKLVYTFNALVASRWRDRRVLIAGDAAHMMPQFMGQGASSGLRDAANLAWKLDLVLRSVASPELLDTYESERRSHAKAMIVLSVAVKDVISMTNPLLIRVRNLVLRVVTGTPGLRRWFREGGFKPKPLYLNGTYFGRRRRRWRGPEGTLSPQPEVRTASGHHVLLDDVSGNGFALIGLACDPRAGLKSESRRLLESLRTNYVALFPYGGKPLGLNDVARDQSPDLAEVEDIHGTMVAWFRKAGHRANAVAILRPDKFVYAVVTAGRLDEEVQGLRGRLREPKACGISLDSTETREPVS